MTGTSVKAMTVPIPTDVSQLVLHFFPTVRCLEGSSSPSQSCIISDQQCYVAMVAFVDCNREDDGRISDVHSYILCSHVHTYMYMHAWMFHIINVGILNLKNPFG